MFEYCIVEKDEDYKLLEENIYYSFVERQSGKWFEENYQITGNKRMKPFFDYKDLLCFLMKEEGKIISGTVFYIGSGLTQIEKIGFVIPDWLRELKFCEGLLLFQLESKYNPGYTMDLFSGFYIEELKKRNFEAVICTCYDFMYKIYTKFAGFEVVDKEFDSEIKQQEYFLYKKL